MNYDDLAYILSHAFTVTARPVGDGPRRWVFDVVTDPQEAERCAVCRKIALDIAAAGLGWHEDALLRLTRPPITVAATAVRRFLLGPRFPHRRCGIKSRHKGRVRYDATA